MQTSQRIVFTIVAWGHLRVAITFKMITSVISACDRYMEELRQQKQVKETVERSWNTGCLKRYSSYKRARLEQDKLAMLEIAYDLCQQADVSRSKSWSSKQYSRKTAKEKAAHVHKINKDLSKVIYLTTYEILYHAVSNLVFLTINLIVAIIVQNISADVLFWCIINWMSICIYDIWFTYFDIVNYFCNSI